MNKQGAIISAFNDFLAAEKAVERLDILLENDPTEKTEKSFGAAYKTMIAAKNTLSDVISKKHTSISKDEVFAMIDGNRKKLFDLIGASTHMCSECGSILIPGENWYTLNPLYKCNACCGGLPEYPQPHQEPRYYGDYEAAILNRQSEFFED